MTRVVVVEHEAQCPPAHLATWLERAGAAPVVCRPWAGDPLPAAGDADAWVVMGGSMAAWEDERYPWLGPVKQVIRDVVELARPLLGVCLGHQLMAVALGGVAEPNPRGQQVGLFEVGWLPAAADDELVAGLGPIRGVQWNRDLVTRLPEGAVALAETPAGELQVARYGPRAWGVQLHPEVDEPVVRSWAAGDRDDHLERGIDQAAVLRQIQDARVELDHAWEPALARFVELAR